MLDFIIDIFMQWFTEGFGAVLFARLFRLIDLHIKNKALKNILSILLIVICCAIALGIAFCFIVLIIFCVVKIFTF